MRLAHFFIDRPIFATVLSVFVTLVGLGALAILPIAQYPEIVPPTVQITTIYPGASAETVSRTVATPLEQEINGVENMIYMASQSTSDGNLSLTVTFEVGTDIDRAQAEGATTGFIKLVLAGKKDEIVGAHMVGARSGELLGEMALAMQHNLTLNDILATIHAYPTMNTGIQQAVFEAYLEGEALAGNRKLVRTVLSVRG